MSSNVPTIRQINWISILPQLVVIGIFLIIWKLINVGDPFLIALLTYLILSICLRTLIPHDHRKGMSLVKQIKYAEAIEYFEKSYAFFSRHNWIDKYRFVTLLSSSRMCYKEMALANIAFCYGQIGDGLKSKEYYERTLKEYPDNGIAKAGLNLLNSATNKKD
jgi:tetratricopeptide (TPR) repeat protein